MTRSIRALANPLVLWLWLLGCQDRLNQPQGNPTEGPAQNGGTLTMSTFVHIRTVDPAVAFDEASEPIVRLLFSRLFRVSRTGQIEGDLVAHHELSPNGLELTMELRRDARFHDGSPVLAGDVKRSFERAFHPKTPCPVPSFFDRIVGLTEYRKGKSSELAGVTALSDHVVRITLREPDATLLPILTLGITAPVCRSAGYEYDPQFDQIACGAGPFRLASWQGRDVLELKRHESYHDASHVHLSGIRWMFGVPSTSQRYRFERGELDIVHELTAADSIAFRADPRWAPLGSWSRPRSTRGIFMNTEMPPFHDVNVRRAIALAIDRNQIASLRAGHLVAANGMIPSGVVGYDPSFSGQQHDLSQALQLMKRAGWPYDPSTDTGGYPHPIDYYCAADSFDVAVAEIFQQQLQRIGIRLRIKAVSWAAYLSVTGRRQQAAMGADGWSADFDDPSDFFDPLFSSEAIQQEESQNRAFYNNPRLDSLLARARREMQPNERKKLYHLADGIVRDEAPWATVYGFRYYDVHQGYVQGYTPHPHAYLDVASVWLSVSQRTLAARARKAPPLSIASLAYRLCSGRGR
ncbi:MAG TPA: ABC transporter substrate-binding protein [Polyangiaceae bacterium]|nr:MAG: Glutathione-binding protein GsiB precursor [Deltaproteobacteria bacterium ADurb.Bin207]HNS96627.1 ABC transporter substrate-binding protein [Polyangiaceae bacterium]HNZ21035.1 ABC transporter substrate-binding protein [Polyangiaceae bacterium]HOD24428.1 ABC transporter substrate-binding protein [Polyangiaceae bacterium]HOE51213.1 ABC transporter substrate-binding protein [Polyangiaceae bacterium]